jgi:hypothetical protein
MTSVPETPGPRKIYERALRRTAERQQMRLVRSARRDPTTPDYGTYTLISQSGSGVAVLERASMQAIEEYLHRGNSKYARVPPGERIDAVEGSIVGVQPGVIIDNLKKIDALWSLRMANLLSCPTKDWQPFPTTTDSANTPVDGAHQREMCREALRTAEISIAGQTVCLLHSPRSGGPRHRTRPTGRLTSSTSLTCDATGREKWRDTSRAHALLVGPTRGWAARMLL